MTPIVYPFMLVVQKGGLLAALYKFNPIVWIVVTFNAPSTTGRWR